MVLMLPPHAPDRAREEPKRLCITVSFFMRWGVYNHPMQEGPRQGPRRAYWTKRALSSRLDKANFIMQRFRHIKK